MRFLTIQAKKSKWAKKVISRIEEGVAMFPMT